MTHLDAGSLTQRSSPLARTGRGERSCRKLWRYLLSHSQSNPETRFEQAARHHPVVSVADAPPSVRGTPVEGGDDSVSRSYALSLLRRFGGSSLSYMAMWRGVRYW